MGKRTLTPLTPAQLDQATAITPKDLAEDVVFWRENGSGLTNAYLNADPGKETT